MTSVQRFATIAMPRALPASARSLFWACYTHQMGEWVMGRVRGTRFGRGADVVSVPVSEHRPVIELGAFAQVFEKKVSRADHGEHSDTIPA
jgi:hypothetical protein